MDSKHLTLYIDIIRTLFAGLPDDFTAAFINKESGDIFIGKDLIHADYLALRRGKTLHQYTSTSIRGENCTFLAKDYWFISSRVDLVAVAMTDEGIEFIHATVQSMDRSDVNIKLSDDILKLDYLKPAKTINLTVNQDLCEKEFIRLFRAIVAQNRNEPITLVLNVQP
jgi:hypothetical protein